MHMASGQKVQQQFLTQLGCGGLCGNILSFKGPHKASALNVVCDHSLSLPLHSLSSHHFITVLFNSADTRVPNLPCAQRLIKWGHSAVLRLQWSLPQCLCSYTVGVWQKRLSPDSETWHWFGLHLFYFSKILFCMDLLLWPRGQCWIVLAVSLV